MQQFSVDIVGCSITSLSVTQPSQTTYNYDILQPVATLLSIPVPLYTVTPSNCLNGDKDGLLFELVQNPANPAINFDNNFNFVELASSDPNDFG